MTNGSESYWKFCLEPTHSSSDATRTTTLQSRKFQQALATTSRHLVSLTIDIGTFDYTHQSHVDVIARPKRLTLIDFNEREDFSWMWRACNQVGELEISPGGFSRMRDHLIHPIHEYVPHLQ